MTKLPQHVRPGDRLSITGERVIKFPYIVPGGAGRVVITTEVRDRIFEYRQTVYLFEESVYTAE